VFCKNRDRLLDGDIASKFMTEIEPKRRVLRPEDVKKSAIL